LRDRIELRVVKLDSVARVRLGSAMTKLTMRNDFVLVLMDQQETMRSGLYVPSSAIEAITRGTVDDVGPGYLRDDGSRTPLDLAPGDRVELRPVSGQAQQITIDGESYFIVRDIDVVGVVTDEAMPEALMPAGVEE
jgi:chaperonin GroES